MVYTYSITTFRVTFLSMTHHSLVPRPLIQRVYRLQYILKAIRAGVGLGLGPRLDPPCTYVHTCHVTIDPANVLSNYSLLYIVDHGWSLYSSVVLQSQTAQKNTVWTTDECLLHHISHVFPPDFQNKSSMSISQTMISLWSASVRLPVWLARQRQHRANGRSANAHT